MGTREYRLSDPPSWPIRILGLCVLGIAATNWFILPTTIRGGVAPLVPALVLEAIFFGALGAALLASPDELQDAILGIVVAGAIVVALYVPAQAVYGNEFTHPVVLSLLSLLVGVVGVLVAIIPAFSLNVFTRGNDHFGISKR